MKKFLFENCGETDTAGAKEMACGALNWDLQHPWESWDMAHTCNLSTGEVEAGELGLTGRPAALANQ